MMKLTFTLILIAHGLIHLLGTAKAFGTALPRLLGMRLRDRATLSFPAGAQRRGRESIGSARVSGSPSRTSCAGDDTLADPLSHLGEGEAPCRITLTPSNHPSPGKKENDDDRHADR